MTETLTIPLSLGMHFDVDEATYFADPCVVPSLSNSIAKVLLNESPKRAWHLHPKGGGGRSESTLAQKEGLIIDALLLGAADKIATLDFPDYRTKAAKEARDEALAEGKIPVVAKKMDRFRQAAQAISESLAEEGVVLNGQNQVTVVWEEPSASGPVLCRGRLDHLKEGLIYDLKKAASVHPDKLSRAMTTYGYDIQAAAYTSAMEKITGNHGRWDFQNIFVEVDDPFDVVVARPDSIARKRGQILWRRAVETWGWCLKNTNFYGASGTPGISRRGKVVELWCQPWALNEVAEEMEMTDE